MFPVPVIVTVLLIMLCTIIVTGKVGLQEGDQPQQKQGNLEPFLSLLSVVLQTHMHTTVIAAIFKVFFS